MMREFSNGRRRFIRHSLLATGSLAFGLDQFRPDVALAANVPVPEIKQNTDLSCARACVVMALNHFGFEVGLDESRTTRALPDEAHITEHVVPSIGKLTNGWMYGEYFEDNRLDWTYRVNAETHADYPVIALIPFGNKLGWSFTIAHYVVIRGLNRDRNEVYFNDPWARGKPVRRTMSLDQFADAWGAEKSRWAKPWQGVTLWST